MTKSKQAVESAPSQLTKYLERLAHWLQDKRPSYVDKYSVQVSTFKHGIDQHCVKLAINLYISEAKLIELDKGGLVERES